MEIRIKRIGGRKVEKESERERELEERKSKGKENGK